MKDGRVLGAQAVGAGGVEKRNRRDRDRDPVRRDGA
jgi:hypothetical protein